MAATLTIAQHVILKAVTYAFTPLNASQVRAAAGLPSATSALETTQAALADLLALGLVERQVTGGRSTYRATWDAQAALDAHEAAKAAQHAAAVTVHPERNAPAVPAPFHYVATGPMGQVYRRAVGADGITYTSEVQYGDDDYTTAMTMMTQAQTMAQITGSVAATVSVENVQAGQVVKGASATWNAPARPLR